MSDGLDSEIQRAREAFRLAEADAEAAKAGAVELQRRAELQGVHSRALERAAELRPARHEQTRFRGDVSTSRGRQPGAIPQAWRSILVAAAAKHPDEVGELEFVDLARAEGRSNTKPKDVRSRMNDYEQHGCVKRTLNGWLVTEYAVSKFRSDTVEESSNSTENEVKVETADTV